MADEAREPGIRFNRMILVKFRDPEDLQVPEYHMIDTDRVDMREPRLDLLLPKVFKPHPAPEDGLGNDDPEKTRRRATIALMLSAYEEHSVPAGRGRSDLSLKTAHLIDLYFGMSRMASCGIPKDDEDAEAWAETASASLRIAANLDPRIGKMVLGCFATDDEVENPVEFLRAMPPETRTAYWSLAVKVFIEAERLLPEGDLLATSLTPRSTSLYDAMRAMSSLLNENCRTQCHEWAESWHSETDAVRLLGEVLSLRK